MNLLSHDASRKVFPNRPKKSFPNSRGQRKNIVTHI